MYKGKTTAPRPVPPTIESMLASKKAMLSGPLPYRYSALETPEDVVAEAFKNTDDRIVRLTIIWDNPVRSLDLEGVLDTMRGTGAAMVVKAEEVK